MRRLLAFLAALFGKRKPTPIPPYVAPAVPCTHGVIAHQLTGNVAQMDELGCKLARITYYVREPDPKYHENWAWQLPYFDAHGIEPLIIIHDTDSADHTVETLVRLTGLYPNRLWQIGNEWNAGEWSRGGFGNTGTKYAEIMRRLIAACPVGTRFVGVGLAYNYAQPEYLRSYLAAGGPTLKAWCIHVYGVPVTLTSTVQETQDVLRGRMPLWITEYGIDRTQQELAWGPRTDAQIDEEQRRTVAEVTQNAGRLGVSRAYHYDMNDDSDFGFGLVRADGVTKRPSWYAMLAAM